MPRINSPAELEALRKEIISKRDPKKTVHHPLLGFCLPCLGQPGSGGQARRGDGEAGPCVEVDLRKTGCHGFCERGPIIVIRPDEICYFQIKPEDVPEIVSETIKEKKVIERLLYTDPVTNEKIVHESEIPFYKNQGRIVFGSNVSVDPKSIDDYLAIGGYAALAKALADMSPDEVLQEVKKANLRGRGGGGFPAGTKWEGSRNAPGDIKYVIVNADEGDPGRLHGQEPPRREPPRGARGPDHRRLCHRRPRGLYLRPPGIPPGRRKREHRHQDRPRSSGLLGKNILGSGFDFVVKVHRGAGAFVCGESTALMTAIEGRAGEPRPKYIRSNIVGLWGRPCVLNNVETWANVPAHHQQGRRLVHPDTARRRARARRSSPSSARSPTRASWKCPWALP